jgi:uncharacterized protein
MRVRVVFDTNVYVPAALNSSGPSGVWLRIAGSLERSFDLYTSDAIIRETADKLSEKFGSQLSPAAIEGFITDLRQVATVVTPIERIQAVERDPDDDMVLECAVAAKAHLIVSADKDLLDLGDFRGIGICHPRDLNQIFASDLAQHRRDAA